MEELYRMKAVAPNRDLGRSTIAHGIRCTRAANVFAAWSPRHAPYRIAQQPKRQMKSAPSA